MTDNFERGDTALKALAAGGYERLEDTKDRKIPLPDGGVVTDPGFYPASDLIADLCHALSRYQMPVTAAVTHGLQHFGADVIEQAWEHDDEWNPTLQDESNEERARTVMRAAGVPERYHHGALVKTGILPPDAFPPERGLYRESLDPLTCAHDDHGPEECDNTTLFLHSRCHPSTPTWVEYDKTAGTATVTCAECDAHVAVLAVASREEEIS